MKAFKACLLCKLNARSSAVLVGYLQFFAYWFCDSLGRHYPSIDKLALEKFVYKQSTHKIFH